MLNSEIENDAQSDHLYISLNDCDNRLEKLRREGERC